MFSKKITNLGSEKIGNQGTRTRNHALFFKKKDSLNFFLIKKWKQKRELFLK